MSSADTIDKLAITRLGAALGAEITGTDLARPLDRATFDRLRAALQEHHLLCFRDQTLSPAEQIAFSELFGPLEAFPEADKTKTEATVYHVANTSAEGEHLPESDPRVIFQKVNARWHTDSSYRYIPSFLSLLYGIEVLPPEADGGETEFSNMFRAYDALPAELRDEIEPLHMVHYYEFGRRMFPQLPPVSQVEREFVPPVAHPLVRVHRDRNDRRSLFMTTNSGNEISGMTLEEGQALHQRLAAHVSRPEFCYRHRWRAGDLVVWDNRCLLHRARPYDMARWRRVFRRTTVAGEGPILGPYSRALRRAAG
jgi:alpha-ketoglutarate-dependent 2,4-dichlorophenoxyacetate dioxygenase